MRYPLLILFFLAFHGLFWPGSSYVSQAQTKDPILDTGFVQEIDTLTLPFYDDFDQSVRFADLTKWVCAGNTLVTNRMALNIPTTNILHFDGLDSSMTPYFFPIDNGSTTLEVNGETDYIVSFPIDLSGVTTDDNLALSFFWQKGGLTLDHFSEMEQGDSLGVFGLTVDTTWLKIWPTEADIPAVDSAEFGNFDYAFTRIDREVFYHAGFRMRFETKGRLSGNYDTWSIDNVYLNTGREIQDTIEDVSVVLPSSSLLTPYRSMPIRQFLSDPVRFLSDSVTSSAFSLQSDSSIVNDVEVQIYLHHDSVNVRFYTQVDGSFAERIQPFEPFPFGLSTDKSALVDGFNLVYEVDMENVFLETQTTAVFSDTVRYNDVGIGINVLDNYYAYDDGTAEHGIGIQDYGEVAVEYELYTPDTLIGVALFFPKLDFNLAGSNSITVRAWDAIRGVNEANSDNLLGAAFETISYKDTINPIELGIDFIDLNYVEFAQPIPLEPGKFYVGYEQLISRRFPIGLDKSSNSMDKVYTHSAAGASWTQRFLEATYGNVMIRPVFGDPVLVGTEELELTNFGFEIYPNPSEGEVFIVTEGQEVEILDLVGQTYLTQRLGLGEHVVQLNLHEFQEGMYLVKSTKNGHSQMKKLVIER